MSNSELKEYVVTLHKHEDLDSFYEDMETPGGNLYIPDRVVNIASRRAISRNTHYWLSDEEARQLKLDPRVWDVQPYEELDIHPAWQDTNQVYSKSASNILSSDRNWGIASIFDKSFDANWGSNSTARKTASYQSKVDGLNVDFVIYGNPFDYAQPEFAVNEDGTGGTRYRYTDWHDFINDEVIAELTSRGLNPSHYTQDLSPAYEDKTVSYLYASLKPYNLEAGIFHESICASIILGNRQGLSRRANFYTIRDPSGGVIFRRETTAPYAYGASFEFLFSVRTGFFYIDLVRRWHLAKGINSNTGFKNPTVFADSHVINYGVHPEQIVKINYRGVDYTESFNSFSDYYKYKLWRNDTGTIQYGQSPGRVVWQQWRAQDQADVESAIADGIICVEASANERAYIDLPTGPDYNNQIFFINPSITVRWPLYGNSQSIYNGYENFATWIVDYSTYTPGIDTIIFFEGDGSYYRHTGSANWVSLTKNDIVSTYPDRVVNQYYNRGHGMTSEKVIVASSISDKADGSVSPRSSRGPGIDIWAPSRSTASVHYPGSTPWDPDGTGYYGSTGQLPGTVGDLPTLKIIRDNRNSNYFLCKGTDGTSFAQPHVSGVIGLWLEMNPGLTQNQIKSLLTSQGYSISGTNTLTPDAAGVNHNYYDPTGLAGAPTLALGFSPPTFAISVGTNVLTAGQSVTYTITTTNVPNGSTLYLKESGNAIATDFVDNQTQFAIVINSNNGTLTRTLKNTFIGTKFSNLELRTGGYNGTIQTTAPSVSLLSGIMPIWVTPAGSFGTITQYQYSERFLAATNAVSYSLVSGSLPSGMSLVGATGLIQGIPVLDNFSSTIRLYTFNFTVRATSSTSLTSDRTFSITVSTKSPFLRGPYSQNRVISSATGYSFDLGSYGVDTGLGIQWRIAQGRLPPNAQLSATGRVTVNFDSPILPFEPDQFIKPSAPVGIPSLSQDFFQYWLQEYFSTARDQDYEAVLELAEPGGIVNQAYYIRIIHTRVPTPFFGSWFTANAPYIEYDPNQYYYLVLTSLDDKITWNSSYYLGTIENGGISEKSVRASSLSNTTLEYLIKPLYVSEFPQGLKLQSDGLIVGQAAFKCHEDDAVNVPIENFYQFVVRAQTPDATSYSDKTFDLTITRFNQQPYDNLYIRSFPNIKTRQEIQAIFNNTNLFPASFLYRPSDSRFGVNRDLRFLFQGGLDPSSLSEYEPALATNHAVRSIILGQLRTAVNLDQDLNTVYEVVYIDIIDRWLGRDPVTKLPAGTNNTIDLRPYIKNYYVKNGQSYYELLPNGLENMRSLIEANIGVVNYAAIPSWMRCLQPTNKIGIFRSPLGFLPCIVIAYCQPGKSSVIANNLRTVDFNRFKYEFDRYQLEIGSKYYNTATNSYQAVTKTTFDNETTVFDWNSTRVAENVDYYREPGEGDKYIIFPRSGVFI